MKYLARDKYLSKLKSLRDLNIIKIVVGVRGCGKTTILLQYLEYLRLIGVDDSQIIYLDFEDRSNIKLTDPSELHSYLESKLIHNDLKYYIVLDEVQLVNSFERIVNSIYLKDNVDIYLAGSNAYMLSGNMATLLSGRYLEIEILPSSLKELSLYREGVSPTEVYNEYITKGSFPFIYSYLDTESSKRDYLESILSSAILKDVVFYQKITVSQKILDILSFVFSNIGNRFSYHSINQYFISLGTKIDSRTIERYIKALVNSFILYKVKRYDIKNKLILQSLEKLYLVDVALRKIVMSKDNLYLDNILENVVYLELRRRYKRIYTGKINEYEVDFICHNDINDQAYFQVSLSLYDVHTRERELKPLKMIKDNYPKIVITLDQTPQYSINGIKILSLFDWILV